MFILRQLEIGVVSKHKLQRIDLFVLPGFQQGYSYDSFIIFLPLDEDAIKMIEKANELCSAFAKVRCKG